MPHSSAFIIQECIPVCEGLTEDFDLRLSPHTGWPNAFALNFLNTERSQNFEKESNIITIFKKKEILKVGRERENKKGENDRTIRNYYIFSTYEAH